MSAEPTREHRAGPALLYLLVLLASVLFALFGRRMPAPLSADAPLELFSAGRARLHLDEVARAAHPVGSGEHDRVRQHLLEAVRALDLEPEEQRGETRGVPLTNLLARIPGRAPTGTVLCLAHYDSVPSGPGAGDDGIGVVSWLEALRALRARAWRPRNDVLLLLTDGEEFGLLGAHLFAQEHPGAAAVRAVINLEAIGNGGPAVLFETGPGNGALVREFAGAIDAPAGTSLADAVYRRMPNDTDLTVFLRRGVRGYNLAITSGSAAYHAPHDTPKNLDPRSVQHMGECALALLERLGRVDLATLEGADATYFDLLGYALIHHPAAWDGALVALAAGAALGGLVLAVRLGQVGPRELVDRLARFPFECALIVALAFAGWWLIDRAVALVAPAPSWVPGNYTSATLLVAGLAALVLGLELWLAARRPSPPLARMFAALTWWAMAAVGAWIALPGTSFALVWPLFFGALGVLVFLFRERPAPVAHLALALALALPVLLGLPILHLLVQLFQRDPPPAACLASAFLVFGCGLIGPQTWSIARGRKRAARAALALGLGLLAASTLVARVLDWRQGSFLP